jgi:UDP-glucose 4-epimerase
LSSATLARESVVAIVCESIMPRSVVIGGTGFLGAVLVDRLVLCGHDVVTYSRAASSRHHDVLHVSGDIRDTRLLEATLRGADQAFHLASTALPQTSNEDRSRDVVDNLVAGVGVLDACVRADVGLVAFPSTGGAVYGVSTMAPLTEAAPTEPLSSYGITKLAFEKYLALYRRLFGLDYRVLRVSNAYGENQPTDRPQGFIAVALERVWRGEPIIIWGDGSAVRDYVHVSDVSAAFLASVSPLPDDDPRVFNIGSGKGHSLRDLIDIIARVTGEAPEVRWADPRPCDVDRVVLSTRLAEQYLGWRARMPIEVGIERMWLAVYDSRATVSADDLSR